MINPPSYLRLCKEAVMVMAGAVMASIARRVSPSHQCHLGQLEPKKKVIDG